MPINLHLLIQAGINGLLLAGVYVMISLGLNLIYGVMRVINVAHGELLILSAYGAYWLHVLWGINPLLSLLLIVPGMFLVGMLIQKSIIDRVVDSPRVISLLVTWGLSISLVSLIRFFWGPDIRSSTYLNRPLEVANLAIPLSRLVSFSIALLLTFGAFVYLKKSRIGKAIRATSQNKNMAMASGIDVKRIYLITFGLGAALAGAGGPLIFTMYAIQPGIGFMFTIKALVVIILGGLGNYYGAFLGALTLGLVEAYGSLFISIRVSMIFSYLILLITLLIRPTGLLGGHER